MPTNKIKLDFLSIKDIDHDMEFKYNVMVFSRSYPKGDIMKVDSYLICVFGPESIGDITVDRIEAGPAVQEIFDGECRILVTNDNKVVGIGKDNRFLRVKDGVVITRSIKERYKRIAQSKQFQDAYVGRSIGETIAIEGNDDIPKTRSGNIMEYRNTEERIQFERQQFMVLCRSFFPNCTFYSEMCDGDSILVHVYTSKVSELVYWPGYDEKSQYDLDYYKVPGDSYSETKVRTLSLDKLAEIIRRDIFDNERLKPF